MRKIQKFKKNFKFFRKLIETTQQKRRHFGNSAPAGIFRMNEERKISLTGLELRRARAKNNCYLLF